MKKFGNVLFLGLFLGVFAIVITCVNNSSNTKTYYNSAPTVDYNTKTYQGQQAWDRYKNLYWNYKDVAVVDLERRTVLFIELNSNIDEKKEFSAKLIEDSNNKEAFDMLDIYGRSMSTDIFKVYSKLVRGGYSIDISSAVLKETRNINYNLEYEKCQRIKSRYR